MLHMMQMLEGACLFISQMFIEHLLQPDTECLPDGMGRSVQGKSQHSPTAALGKPPRFHFVIAHLCLNPTLKAALESLVS